MWRTCVSKVEGPTRHGPAASLASTLETDSRLRVGCRRNVQLEAISGRAAFRWRGFGGAVGGRHD